MSIDKSFPASLNGIIPPLVTPLLNDHKIDRDGLHRLIDHVIDGGVNGIFILGTTGEGPGLSFHLKEELIYLACEKVKKRVPVLVGITESSVAESLFLAGVSAKANADALVAAPPFYFNLDESETVQYFHHLADNVSLPLFLYNIPSLTKIPINPASVQKLSKHDRIAGLKDSSGNGTYLNTILSIMRDESFPIFVGPDEMMASMVLTGARGGVSAGANIFPKLYTDLYKAVVSGNSTDVVFLHGIVMEISRTIYNAFPVNTGYLKGIKAALSIMGICSDIMEPPLMPFDKGQKAIIKKNLLALNQSYANGITRH